MLYSSSDYYIQAVFAGLLPRMLEIDPRANRAGFMLNKVALGQSFSKSILVFLFDCSLADAVLSTIYYRSYLIRMMRAVEQNIVAKSVYKIHRKT